jgi:ferredoxin
VEKEKAELRQIPQIDRFECTDCESCLSLCPQIFKRNEETGYIEVADLSQYPEEEILEAMSLCPADCITWQEV